MVEGLLKVLHKWWKDTNAPIPALNPEYEH
jgi:hypothetical protein